MKNKKSYIDTYTTIYPVYIVVANENTTLKKLQQLYTYADGCILDDDIMKEMCTVSKCRRISDGSSVLLVKANAHVRDAGVTRLEELVGTCAHEALHVALDVYSYIYESPSCDHQEPLAYLVEYAATCIYKTLTKK